MHQYSKDNGFRNIKILYLNDLLKSSDQKPKEFRNFYVMEESLATDLKSSKKYLMRIFTTSEIKESEKDLIA